MKNEREAILSIIKNVQETMVRVKDWDLSEPVHKNIESILNDIYFLKNDECLDIDKLLSKYDSNLEEAKAIFLTGYIEFLCSRNILKMEFQTKSGESIPTDLVTDSSLLNSNTDKRQPLIFNGNEYSAADVHIVFKRNDIVKKQLKIK